MKTTKMLAGLVGVAGMLVSGVAGAQQTSFSYAGVMTGYAEGEFQSGSCGCNTKQQWNVPEGAAVVGRSYGPFMAIMDVMGERSTHVMLNRGKMPGSDVPKVIHASTYEFALSREWEIEVAGLLDKLDVGRDVSRMPVYPEKLAYNGPGASRTSVAGTYEYFHKLVQQIVYSGSLGSLYSQFPELEYDPEFQSFLQKAQAKNETDPYMMGTDMFPVGFVKTRMSPEYIRWVSGVKAQINVCEGENGFDPVSAIVVRCRPGFSSDGTPTERCWEESTGETVTCFNDTSMVIPKEMEQFWTEYESVEPTVAEPERWRESQEVDRDDRNLSELVIQNGNSDSATLYEETLVDGHSIRVCTWPSQTNKLCYSRTINLGKEAAKQTDNYPATPSPQTWGSSLGVDFTSYNNTEFLHPFHYARIPGNGGWGYNAPNSLAPAGVAAPYYLRQYMDLEGVNEGYATPGLACSTFLSFIQAQSARLAYENQFLGKGFRWDKKYNVVSAKHYPAELTAVAAEQMQAAIKGGLLGNGNSSINASSVFATVLSFGLSNILKNHAAELKAEAAEHAANQIVNCILIGPVNGRCEDTSRTWEALLATPEGQAIAATSISADWMTGRDGYDADGNVLGSRNPRNSIWSKDSTYMVNNLSATFFRSVQFSSEGRVCTCW
jgi:hypothetical protein